jgi:hypothetical protein
MGLAKELFRQLKLSHVLSRMTVVVDEPVQSRPGTLVSYRTWSHSQRGEIVVGDLRTQFPKEPIRCVNPSQELFRVFDMRREFAPLASNDLEDLSLGTEEVDDESGD